MNLFARDSLRTFCAAGKDVLYEAMNREDWNWRALHLRADIVGGQGLHYASSQSFQSTACEIGRAHV